jgi:hypothetical protein
MDNTHHTIAVSRNVGTALRLLYSKPLLMP